jgi:glycerol kinase
VIVPAITETTALGAAYLAGIGAGTWDADQVAEMWRESARYEPRMAAAERDHLLARWTEAVSRAGAWAERE